MEERSGLSMPHPIKKCKFRGCGSTRCGTLRKPCAAAGAPRSKFIKCAGCYGGASYVCFGCLAGVAARLKKEVLLKAGTLKPCSHPVLEGLGGAIDFEKLSTDPTARASCSLAAEGVIVRGRDGLEWRQGGCLFC